MKEREGQRLLLGYDAQIQVEAAAAQRRGGKGKADKAVQREYALYRIETDRRGIKCWTRAAAETMVCSYDEAALVCKIANRGKAKGDRVTVLPVDKTEVGEAVPGLIAWGGSKKKERKMEKIEAAWREEGGVSTEKEGP